MKKRIKFILLCLLPAIFMYSCKDGRKKIRIIGESTSTIEAYKSLESEYEAMNPEIDLEFIATSFDEAFEKTNKDFANKTGLYDIVLQYNFSLSSYVRNNYVQIPTDFVSMDSKEVKSFSKDLFDQTWKTVGHYYENPELSKGIKMVGFPYVANSMLLMYNKEMFNNTANQVEYFKTFGDSLRVPQSWEQYLNVAEFFTNKDKETFGVCMAGSSGSFLYFELSNYLYSMGGGVLDKELGWEGDANTKIILNSPQSLKAFETFLSLKQFNNGAFVDVEQFAQMEIMKKGKTAMAICWEDVISLNIQKDSTFGKKFGFAPIPGSKSIIGGGAFFVNKASKHPKEAFDFIIFTLQPERQKQLALKGLSTPLRSVYSDTEVQKIPHMNALYESLNRGGIFLEAGPDSDAISEVLSNYMQKAWKGLITAEDALSSAEREIREKRSALFMK